MATDTPHDLTVGKTAESALFLMCSLYVRPLGTHTVFHFTGWQVEEMQSLYEEKAQLDESQEEEEEADKTALLQQIVLLLRPGETVLKVQYTAVCVMCVHVTGM